LKPHVRYSCYGGERCRTIVLADIVLKDNQPVFSYTSDHQACLLDSSQNDLSEPKGLQAMDANRSVTIGLPVHAVPTALDRVLPNWEMD
jgi:hypothetical protein